jgi:hypothetical protein
MTQFNVTMTVEATSLAQARKKVERWETPGGEVQLIMGPPDSWSPSAPPLPATPAEPVEVPEPAATDE